MNKLAVLLPAVICIASCVTPHETAAPADWLTWQARRQELVAGTNGWTTLIGLHWLKEGENSAGSAPTNDVVFSSERLPGAVGIFSRRGTNVSFTAAAGVEVRVAGTRVQQTNLVTDAFPNPTRLELGSFSMIAIQRGERLGIRVRDAESAARREFKGLRYFPYDPRWRLEGRFVPSKQRRTLRVPDVTGAFQEFACPGEVVFTQDGIERRLSVAIEPDVPDFFIMFHDETAGLSTYPAGRFLYVTPPTSGDRVIIDFNRAYTPPCGFTRFATCPLPPQENWLPIAIRAGELPPADAHH